MESKNTVKATAKGAVRAEVTVTSARGMGASPEPLATSIAGLVRRQRDHFATRVTLPLEFRRDQLRALQQGIQRYEKELTEALRADLGKSAFDSYISEVGFSLDEIKFAAKRLASWARPRRVRTPLVQFPSSSRIYPEPLGVTLIIGPWNYPLQLLLSPLVGALSAGCCAILKPSELAPHTSQAVAQLIREAFDPALVSVVEGGVVETQALLKERFDHIFYTGGGAVGKIVMRAAAEHLTPVTLELGGKSPCLVDADAPLEVTAKRIVWGKYFNAGQTCVAPDYLLVHRSLKEPLLAEIKQTVENFFGADPSRSPDYARIINTRHLERLQGLLEGDIVIGGKVHPESRYLAPTVIDNVSADAKVMQEEIFGPILPVLTYEDLTEAIHFVQARPKPLALYFFSRNESHQERVLSEVSFGGGCLNDTLVHTTNPYLPFGGVGNSGIGAYHGEASFRVFSHYKSVLRKAFIFDNPVRYPPTESKLSFVKKLIG